tara:strand:- start:2839 stop:3066 length:228 start_codon:yes stop_codon:yes gene_type:complete
MEFHYEVKSNPVGLTAGGPLVFGAGIVNTHDVPPWGVWLSRDKGMILTLRDRTRAKRVKVKKREKLPNALKISRR